MQKYAEQEQKEKSESFVDEVFFCFFVREKETNMQGTNAITQKRTQENFI